MVSFSREGAGDFVYFRRMAHGAALVIAPPRSGSPKRHRAYIIGDNLPVVPDGCVHNESCFTCPLPDCEYTYKRKEPKDG